ncbi:hypothetical protein SPRG_11147 [Saprolegnia parasitica CBS 223.65]|uniref:Uncharacterized protein n=1 Tax=Saprolegnia parasitica (strain CBS 223.65) TaxID=695850 RepID=A0A067C286_SAPPC|nr:hypothetical protein SPRG_11147 [Saprolegnia parasitica CBS 223.65]KDO23215.1 hypothetical protein SPRG_11147 [Saprolegnia parasitica CBS 223.65]|eukprot:XP_012206014.1 hypothetical protein SPRG_11147 [Saprolegnia parasitica CBS 223.65]
MAELPATVLRVSPHAMDPELALHLCVVEGSIAIIELWLRHEPALVTSGTLELAAASSQGLILRLLLERFPELATPTMMDLVAMSGDLSLLRWLHDAGVSCTTAAMDGAAMNGHLDVVVFLYEARTEGCTIVAATAAVVHGHADIVRFLLSHCKEGIEPTLSFMSPDRNHKTQSVPGTKYMYIEAIDLAAATATLCKVDLSPVIRRLGLPALQHFYTKGYLKMTPLTLELAVTLQDHAMLTYILAILCDEHASCRANNAGEWCPLDDDDAYDDTYDDGDALDDGDGYDEYGDCYEDPIRWDDCTTTDSAASLGNLAAIQLLHASRLRCATERTMMYAACNGHLHVLQWLHAHRTDGCSGDAVVLAAVRGHTDVVSWLVDVYGLPPTNAALASAAATGNLPLVQYLMQKLPNAAASDRVGHGCCCYASVPSVHGCSSNFKGEYFDGRPTDWAIRHGHLEVLQCLVAHGCMVSSVAMHDAVRYGRVHIVVYLRDVFGQRCSTFNALLMAVRHLSIDVAHGLFSQKRWATTDDPGDRAIDVRILSVHAARRGDVAMLDLVTKVLALDSQLDLPRRVQELMLVRAAAHGHLEMLRYLVQTHGFAWTSAVESAAQEGRRKRVLGFLATLGPAVPSAHAIGDVTLKYEVYDDSRLRDGVDEETWT